MASPSAPEALAAVVYDERPDSSRVASKVTSRSTEPSPGSGRGRYTIIECLEALVASTPLWIARLDELNAQLTHRQTEFSKFAEDEQVEQDNEIPSSNSSSVQHASPDPAFPAAVPEAKYNWNRQSSPPLPSSQPRMTSGPLPGKRTKPVASFVSGELNESKNRTRSMVVVHYDSVIQSTLEELVELISGNRNSMRKAKMAAKLAEMQTASRLEFQTDSGDGDEKIDERKFKVPFPANQSSDIFDKLDKMLGKSQSFCELGAAVGIKGERDNVITIIKKELEKIANVAGNRIAELKKEAPSPTTYPKTQWIPGFTVIKEQEFLLIKDLLKQDEDISQIHEEGDILRNDYSDSGKKWESGKMWEGGKKTARKPLTSEPTSKLRAQNLAAQRAFRERTEKHLKDLETKVENLQKALGSTNNENSILRAPIETKSTEYEVYTKQPASAPRFAANPLTALQAHPTTVSSSRLRLFAIDPKEDEDVILLWQNRILPALKTLLHRDNDKSVSISLLREGTSREESKPLIRIQTSNPRSKTQQAEVKNTLLDVSPEFTPSIRFAIGSVRRTARRSDLDLDPCAPRNTAFAPRPCMGASIGVDGSVTDTATLGGYISIDEVPHILTVYHLFEDEDSGLVYEPGTIITQPSLQELQGKSHHVLVVDASKNKIEEPSDLPLSRSQVRFGNLTCYSGFRNRPRKDATSNVEMDWAICQIAEDRLGSNSSPCRQHACQKTSQITPGESVFAFGRTSGRQEGLINGCLTNLRFWEDDMVSRESDEWAIIKPDSMSEESWVTHGIGVSGDSGAWVLETGSDHVVGQVWGRDFQEDDDSFGQIITYFTPILDIFDDISDITKAKRVSLYVSEDGNEQGNDKIQEIFAADHSQDVMPKLHPEKDPEIQKDLKAIDLATARIHVSQCQEEEIFELTKSSTTFS
ncbi:hypothetical protein BDZ45DRAFT_685160 [Acephala macrosclerotiorum]|nr:hypothetical protein BDZ45DRAFT_685160 [Acephala macrosclerotiorum]